MLNSGNVLNINPEIIYLIIDKAKEFQAKEEVTFDEKMNDSEYEFDWSQILADHADDETLQEVNDLIEGLEPDQQVDLLTLFYVGRGDFDSNEWSEAHKEARRNIAPYLTRYLFSHPMVADYLEKGLEVMGYSNEEK